MKKVLGILGGVAAVVVVLLAMGVGKFAGRAGAEALFDETTGDDLLAAVMLTNQQLPRMVDETARLDRVSHEPGRVLTYHYTLMGYYAPIANPDGIVDPFDRVDPLGIRADLDGYKERLVQGACKSPSIRSFLKNKMTVVYHYNDANGRKFFDVAIPPERCGLPER
ncbi:hypothetical protein [Lysobacter sp. CA199]|uniref:hypothetical protein n=1 Tax=Lysobacter sp. CA199 TaxID=3455608 RepID=UPI003F8D7FEC